MFKKFLQQLTIDVAIDLGSSNTRVYVKDRGIIAREPTVVSVHKKSKITIAMGTPAKQMIGKTPQSIITIKPIRHAVISDVDRVNEVLREMLQRAMHIPNQKINLKFVKPRVLINIPAMITEVEKKATRDVCLKAGAGEVLLIENPMAAAIGAGLLVSQPLGSAVICLGGGVTEMAILSLGGIVSSKTIRSAGDEFDQLIINYIKQVHNVLIGEKTAEDIKLQIGSAILSKDEHQQSHTVRGRDLKSGLPKTIDVYPGDVAVAIKPLLEEIGKSLSDMIDSAPPEVVSDVLTHGVTLAGAGAQIKNIGQWFEEYIRFPVHIADDPSTCVVRGSAKAMEDPQILNQLISSNR